MNEQLKEKCPTTIYQDVLYFRLKKGEVFCFNYGCVVFWNLSLEEERDALLNIKEYEHEPQEMVEMDEFTFDYGPIAQVEQDEIILEDPKDSLAKLSVSYGVAQSVKLAIYEMRIEQAIRNTTTITQALSQKGRVPLSRQQIGRKIGELFLERSWINLHSDFLGPPDFFWEHADYEPLYRLIAKDLDVKTRTQALNRKLAIIHELFEILGDELNHRHSTRLEWIIIILILIEVIIGLTNLYSHAWH